MSLSEYAKLDLSRDGRAGSALLALATKEAAGDEIVISGEHNSDFSRPPFMTRLMQVWYLQVVAGIRGPALQEVRNMFAEIDLGRGQRGFLIESERDRIEQRKFSEIEKERDQYFSNEKVKRTAAELHEAKYAYEKMKADNGGDDANEWSNKVYIATLTLLALPEIPLNFESFSKFPLMTPAIAVALVLIVAAGIGFSSHIIGMTIKQWGELFGGFVSRREKMKSVRFLSLGITLFTIAMSIVTAGRSLLFQEDIQRKVIIGEPLTFNDYMAFGFSVGGNILIWAIGVVIAYVAHSHIPGFGAKQKTVKKLQVQASYMHERDLQHRTDKHVSKAQHDLQNLEQFEARQLRNRPEYSAVRGAFETLRKIDNQALALLEEYRAILVDEARRQRRVEFIIENINSLSEDKRSRVDASTYEHFKLRLPYA